MFASTSQLFHRILLSPLVALSTVSVPGKTEAGRISKLFYVFESLRFHPFQAALEALSRGSGCRGKRAK